MCVCVEWVEWSEGGEKGKSIYLSSKVLLHTYCGAGGWSKSLMYQAFLVASPPPSAAAPPPPFFLLAPFFVAVLKGCVCVCVPIIL